jgi:hypothetical protein
MGCRLGRVGREPRVIPDPPAAADAPPVRPATRRWRVVFDVAHAAATDARAAVDVAK